MNKAIQKMMVALAVCGALCGTAMAAPKGGQPQASKGGSPTAQALRAPAKPAATKASGTGLCAPQRAEVRKPSKPQSQPRREVARHESHRRPAPAAQHRKPPRHHAPRHDEPRHEHHNGTLHTEDWCSMGASLLGGILGGMIGSAM